MSEPRVMGKSLYDMDAQIQRIKALSGMDSGPYATPTPQYLKAMEIYRRYGENIKNTKKSRELKDKIEAIGRSSNLLTAQDREEFRKLNRALFGRKYSRKTYMKK